MPAHAVGADQHDHPQVIDDQPARALATEIHDLGGGDWLRLADLAATAWLKRRLGALEQRTRLRAELVEIGAPAGIDRRRIVEIAGVEILDERAVAAVQECGLLEFASLGHRSRPQVAIGAVG
jgi:hypothetical protein